MVHVHACLYVYVYVYLCGAKDLKLGCGAVCGEGSASMVA